MRTVEFRPQALGYLLSGIFALLFASNAYGIYKGGIIALPSLLITGVVLYMVLARHRWTKPIVRLWAAILMFSGAFGVFFLLVASPRGVSPIQTGGALFSLVLGGLVYSIERWCILSPEKAELLKN